MPRRALPSTTLSAVVRRYFGLAQYELAQWLGVSAELVKHIEAGRRGLAPAVFDRLLPLARHLPPAPPAGAPPLSAPALPPPDRAPLEARLDYCRHHAVRARRACRPYEQAALHAARWQAALPALLAVAPPDQAPWLERRAAPLTGADHAQWHLLQVRAEALEMEAAALEARLAA